MEFPSGLFENEVLYKVEDGVALITLNAPQRMNTMGKHMNTGVAAALDMAAADSNVHVVVLTGC